MKVLAIRTDKPEAELYLYEDKTKLAEIKWEAHRQLGVTIHKKLEELYKQADVSAKNIDGIIIYKGPGSFTGLRIGFTVANTLSNLWNQPIVSSSSDGWIEKCINKLVAGKNEKIALPEYGGPAHTTQPKH